MMIPTIPSLMLLPRLRDPFIDRVGSLMVFPESWYVEAFMPHLMRNHWRFMDTNAWILPLAGLLPDQQAVLRGIGACEVEAETFCFFTEYPDGLHAYQKAIREHCFCVFNTGDGEPNFYIEAYVVRK